ncbi:hypothetical protein TREES_T100008362 [Tupaia chinensis]|uniref:Uncharacterized protein n=1 Tax=Tupaia chinensis TaxID=246437 RepID=L9LEM9_TUPCH|nr:hypothetical protein TREES_T100008362 [Tupaia chinensis]
MGVGSSPSTQKIEAQGQRAEERPCLLGRLLPVSSCPPPAADSVGTGCVSHSLGSARRPSSIVLGDSAAICNRLWKALHVLPLAAGTFIPQLDGKFRKLLHPGSPQASQDSSGLCSQDLCSVPSPALAVSLEPSNFSRDVSNKFIRLVRI